MSSEAGEQCDLSLIFKVPPCARNQVLGVHRAISSSQPSCEVQTTCDFTREVKRLAQGRAFGHGECPGRASVRNLATVLWQPSPDKQLSPLCATCLVSCRHRCPVSTEDFSSPGSLSPRMRVSYVPTPCLPLACELLEGKTHVWIILK